MKIRSLCSKEETKLLEYRFPGSEITEEGGADTTVFSPKALFSPAFLDLSGVDPETSFLLAGGACYPVGDLSALIRTQDKERSHGDLEAVKQINRVRNRISIWKKETVFSSYPSRIQMETTSFCNAECIMCPHCYSRNKDARNMDEAMLEKIEPMLPYLESVYLHGNGEPLLSPSFTRMVDLYAGYGVKLHTNTNLSLLNGDVLDRLGPAFASITISCDGCTRETYEGIRRGLSFERLVRNVQLLHRTWPSLKLKLNCVIMRQNVQELPQFPAFAKELGFSEIIFSDLGTSPVILKNEDDKLTHYPHYAALQLLEAEKEGEALGIPVRYSGFYKRVLQGNKDRAGTLNEAEKEKRRLLGKPFWRSREEDGEISRFVESFHVHQDRLVEDLLDLDWDGGSYETDGTCQMAFDQPFIDLDGNVCVCCISSTVRTGNLREEEGGFQKVWNSEAMQRLRQSFYDGQLPRICQGCQFLLSYAFPDLTVKNPDGNLAARINCSRAYETLHAQEKQDRDQ